MPIDITVCDRVKRRLDEVMLVGDEPRADQLATTIRTLLFGRAPEGRRLADSCHLEHSAASVQHWDGHSLTVGDCWVPDGSDEQWQHTMDDSGRFTMVERVLMDAFVGIPMRDDGYRDATGSLLQHLTRPHCVAGCIRPEHLIYIERGRMVVCQLCICYGREPMLTVGISHGSRTRLRGSGESCPGEVGIWECMTHCWVLRSEHMITPCALPPVHHR